jgi:hypothetical protein
MTDINDYLESLKTKLEEVIVEFQTKYNSLPQLEIDLLASINAVLDSGGGGGGGSGATAAEIKTAIETASNLDGFESAIGSPSSLKVTDSNAVANLISLVKGLQAFQEDILNNTAQLGSTIGTIDDLPTAGDADAGTFISLFKRLLAVKLPTSLGQKPSANSFPVVLSSDFTIGKPPDLTVTNTSTTLLLATTDITDYSSLSLQIPPGAPFSATIQVRGGNTISDLINVNVVNSNGVVQKNITSSGIYQIPKSFKFIRIEVNSYMSGTITSTFSATNLTSPITPSVKSLNFDSPGIVTATVGTSASTIAGANLARKRLIITNIGSNTVFIDFTAGVTTSSWAIALNPGDTIDEQGEAMYLGTWTAISTASTPLAIREFVF